MPAGIGVGEILLLLWQVFMRYLLVSCLRLTVLFSCLTLAQHAELQLISAVMRRKRQLDSQRLQATGTLITDWGKR